MARGNKIGITAQLDDQVSGKLSKIRDDFDRLGKSAGAKSILQGVGIGAGITAFAALGSAVENVTGFLSDSVAKAKDEQAGIERLTASLQANIAGYDGNRDAIEEVIATREALAFSDGEQRASLALLVTRTHDVTEALGLQREAMDLARLKGMDLATSSEVIGKVYSGNVAILKRYGIAVKDGATATEALAEIQKAASGQAEAFAETAEGSAQALQIAIDDLQEEIGTELLPALKELTTFARTEIVPALHDMFQAVKDNEDAIRQIGPTIAYITGGPLAAMSEELKVIKQAQDEAFAQRILDKINAVKKAHEDDARAAGNNADAVGDLAVHTRDAGEATRDAAKDADDAAGAYDDWRDAIHDATAALNDQKRGHEETGLKIKGVKLDLSDARAELRKLEDVKHPTRDQQIDMNNLRLRILEDRDQLALLKTDLKTAGRVRADVTIDAMNDLGRSVDSTDAKVQALISHLSQVGIPTTGNPSGGTGDNRRARGGPVSPGETYTVGEQGSETLVMGPGGGGYVIPHAGGGGGGGPVVIQLHLDGQVVARVVDRHLYYEAARAPQSPFSG